MNKSVHILKIETQSLKTVNTLTKTPNSIHRNL